jgi:hypothetical protein
VRIVEPSVSMKKPLEKPPKREPYEPPRIRRVKLVPDELAVTGCKSNMIGAEACLRGGVLTNRFRGS